VGNEYARRIYGDFVRIWKLSHYRSFIVTSCGETTSPLRVAGRAFYGVPRTPAAGFFLRNRRTSRFRLDLRPVSHRRERLSHYREFLSHLDSPQAPIHIPAIHCTSPLNAITADTSRMRSRWVWALLHVTSKSTRTARSDRRSNPPAGWETTFFSPATPGKDGNSVDAYVKSGLFLA